MRGALFSALRQALCILLVALAPAVATGVIQLRYEAPVGPGETTASTVRSWGDTVVFVDARTAEKFAAGQIPGAVLLNEEDWDELMPAFLDVWDPDKKVVVYCDGGSCDLSRSAADRLRRELQISEVYVLKGGLPAWEKK